MAIVAYTSCSNAMWKSFNQLSSKQLNNQSDLYANLLACAERNDATSEFV